MVKFELDISDSELETTLFSKEKVCPVCGEKKPLLDDLKICKECSEKPATEDDVQKAVEQTYENHLKYEYMKEFPDKKPSYIRSGKEVESKHFQSWVKEYETKKKENEKPSNREKFDKDMIGFLDKFCIYAGTAKNYTEKIKNGNTLNPEFLIWYIKNADKDHLKHLDYSIMTKENQEIVKTALSIDEKPELNDDKSAEKKDKKPPKSKIDKKNISNQLKENREKELAEKVKQLNETKITFDLKDLEKINLKQTLNDLWKTNTTEIQYQLYMVVGSLSFLYDLMSEKMDFTKSPTDEDIEQIKSIKTILGR